MKVNPDIGDAVLVWIGGAAAPGEGIPIGAKVLTAVDEASWMVWLDVCSMGTHLPQNYRLEELTPLDAETARAHGLCWDCLGYGTTADIDVTMMPSIDHLDEPCPTCGGTGRPHLRVTIERRGSAVTAQMSWVAHEPVVRPDRPDMCVACGMPPAEHKPVEATS